MMNDQGPADDQGPAAEEEPRELPGKPQAHRAALKPTLIAALVLAVLFSLIFLENLAPTFEAQPEHAPPQQAGTSPPSGARSTAPGSVQPAPEQLPEKSSNDLAAAALDRGRDNFQRGRYRTAIQHLDQARRHLETPSPDLEDLAGLAHQNLHQHERAIGRFTAAIEAQDSPSLRINRANSYMNTRRYPEAIADGQAALKMEPVQGSGIHTWAEAHYLIASAHLRLGQKSQARASAQTALSLGQEHGYTHQDLTLLQNLLDRAAPRANANPTGAPAPTPESTPELTLGPAWTATPTPTRQQFGAQQKTPEPTAPTPASTPPAANTPPSTPEPKPESTPVPTPESTPGPTPKPRERPGPTPVFPNPAAQTDLSALRDGIWLQQTYPDVARQLASLPWLRDGLDPWEQRVAQEIVDLVAGPRSAQTARKLLTQPFLKTVEPGDLNATQAIRTIEARTPGALNDLLEHPTFRESGITDSWTPVVAALIAAAQHNQGLIPTLLDHQQVTVETRDVSLPLTGEARLNIVRTGPRAQGGQSTMDALDRAARDVEFFMSVPLPTRSVTILFADAAIPGYDATNMGAAIVIGSESGDMLWATIAHEIAHYYWNGNRPWIDEGMAELIESYHRHRVTGRPMSPSAYPCAHLDNIKQLENEGDGIATTNRPSFVCNYSLGHSLFHQLHQRMGDVPFRTAAQRLYLASLRDRENAQNPTPAGIGQVRTAFNGSPLVERWYSHPSPHAQGSLEDSTPTWKLDELRGKITQAWLSKTPGGPVIDRISAQDSPGLVHLNLRYQHPTFREIQATAHLSAVEIYQNTAYRQRPIEFTVPGNTTGGLWYMSTGPGSARKHRPGVHRIFLYDAWDNKIAQLSYTVTP